MQAIIKFIHKKIIYLVLISKGIDQAHARIMAEQIIYFKYNK